MTNEAFSQAGSPSLAVVHGGARGFARGSEKRIMLMKSRRFFGILVQSVAALGVASPVLAEQTNAPAAPTTPVRVEVVASGLQQPWGLQVLPDGRFLVTEKPGRLRVVDRSGKISKPISGVPQVVTARQAGLLDVALAPDFAQSGGVIYLSFSEAREGGTNGTSVAKAKLVLDGEGGHLDDLTVIFQQMPSYQSDLHFGSRIVVARDGSLFITTGDRYFGKAEAQNPANELGKVVHITPDGAPAVGNPGLPGWSSKVWSVGHRNMQGAALDPETGKLWTIEHGAQGGDELNRPEAGKNYGWPVITYGKDYSGAKIGEGTAKAGLEQPVYYWDPSIAVSGLTFYDGDKFPDWKGNLLVGSLKLGVVVRLVLKDGAVVAQEEINPGIGQRVRDVRQGPDGYFYVLTDDPRGRLLRLVPGA